MIKTLTYSVEQTIAFEMPSNVVRRCVRNAVNAEHPLGYHKVTAIQELRHWFAENHHRPLGLLDAKNLIEMEAGNVVQAA